MTPSESLKFIEIFHPVNINWLVPDRFIAPNHNLGPLCVQQQAAKQSRLTFMVKATKLITVHM